MSTRTFAIPEIWIDEINTITGSLPMQASCRFIPLPVNFDMDDDLLSDAIIKEIQAFNDIDSIMVLLPRRFAKGTAVHLWPGIVTETSSGHIVTSVNFADDINECIATIKLCVYSPHETPGIVNASCQYQPPYTETLNNWVEAGARGFHPGDYFKDEFQNALNTMKGHWFYWGHSDYKKLSGYHHLYAEDLLHYRPRSPLLSTVWFSCATLDNQHEKSIALDWFLSKATLCIMAGINKMNTCDNQLLSDAWLQICRDYTNPRLSDIIQIIIKTRETSYLTMLRNYRILGSLWERISIHTANRETAIYLKYPNQSRKSLVAL